MNLPYRSALRGNTHRLRYLLGVLIPMLMVAPAHASIIGAAEKAYKCLEANGEALVDGATKGVKVLEFIATKPLCVGQLVTPPPAIPQIAMGVTVGVATQQSLKSYDSCTDRIYGFVAKPILGAVKTALDKAPGLPPPLDSLKGGLVNLAEDNAVDLLTSIPGTEVVTGGIDCGCALVDAGLRPETVVQIYNSTKKVVKQCSAVLDELGPLGKGIVAVGGAVATGWNDVVNDPQHMPVGNYYKLHWEPYVESVSQGLAATPPRDVWTPTVRPVFDRCVKYFDGHNQYHDTAVLTCNGMRDGTRDFVGAGFTRGVYNRTWDLLTPGAAEYYGRHLAQDQVGQARAAGLNDAVTQALAKRLFRDFGLDARGNAKRTGNGDVAWAAGSLGDKTRNAKGKSFVGGDPTRWAQELPNSDTVLHTLISKVYNNSATVATVIAWQNAYPAIKAAKCTMPITPPRISVPGNTSTPPTAATTATLSCDDQTLPSAVRQAASTACSRLADSLKNEIKLVCPGAADLSRQELTIGGATYNGRVILVRGLLRYSADGVQVGDPTQGTQSFVATFGILPMKGDWVHGTMGPQKGAQKTLHFLVQITPPAGFSLAKPGKLLVNASSANFDSESFTVVASNEPPSATMDGVTLAAPPPRADMICHTAECREELFRVAAACKKQYSDFAANPANQSGEFNQLSPSKRQEQAAILTACDDKMKAIARASVAAGIDLHKPPGVGGKLPGSSANPVATVPVQTPGTAPKVDHIAPPAVVQPPPIAVVRPPPILVPQGGGQLGSHTGGAISSQLGGSTGSATFGGGTGASLGLKPPMVAGCAAEPNSPSSFVCNDAAAQQRCEQASRSRATCTLRPRR